MIETQTAAINETLARNWWAVALRGTFSVLFGFIALAFPGVTMLSMVLVFSAYMIVDGALAIMAAVRAARRSERWGLLTFEGILDLAAGALAFLWPGLTVVAFVLLVAVWALASGALMTSAGLRLKLEHGRWWLVLGGLASIVYGALLIIAPLVGAIVLTWWLGAYAIIFGALLLIFAFRLKGQHDEAAHGTAVRA
jgi:uncharacterized membrane protein HdeD (DUF308 family)